MSDIHSFADARKAYPPWSYLKNKRKENTMSKEIETKGLYHYDEKDYERGNFEVELIISDQYCDVCGDEAISEFILSLEEGVGLEGSTIELTPKAGEIYIIINPLGQGGYEVELVISRKYFDVCRGEVVAKFVKELSEGVGLEGSTIKLTPRAVEAYVVVRQLE